MRENERQALIAIITSLPGQEEAVGEALAEMVSKMEAEPGVLVYSLNRLTDDPAKYYLFEIFEDQYARDYHRSTPAMEVLQSKLIDRTARPAEVIRLQPIKAKGRP